jgi:hypothetical protein
MASVFWDSEGIIHVDFLSHGAQYYINLLWKRRPGKLPMIIIILHENARPHTADLMKVTLATVDWEIMNHPPSSFENDGELKCSVLNWPHRQDKTFYAAGISKMSG